MRSFIVGSHPLIQLLIFASAGFIGMLLLAGLTLIPMGMMGFDIDAIGNSANLTAADTDDIFLLKVMQLVQALGLFMIPYLLYRWYINREDYKVFDLPYVGWLSAAIFGFALFAAFPLINYLAEWNASLHFPLENIDVWMRTTEKQAEHLIILFLNTDSIAGLLFNLLLIAIIPAIGEELLFRGTFQPLLIKTFRGHHHIAIWVTAFWFSFIHLQFLGFFPRFLLGVILGYAAHWSGSLILPMIGHFVNNALAVLLAYFVGIETLQSDIETMGAGPGQMQLVALSCLMLAGGLYLIYRDSTFDEQPEIEP